MIWKVFLCVFCCFCVGTYGEDPKVSCKPESDFPIFLSSSRGRIRCVFENIESFDDITKPKISGSTEMVSSVVLANSTLSTLPDKFFSRLSMRSVRKFDASKLAIETIESRAFSDIKTFEIIDFSKNKIKKLTDRVFSSMTIRWLDLTKNLIETIDDNAFADAEITKLDLSFNKLTSISFVSSCKSFNALEMNDNLLESLEKIEMKKEQDYPSRRIIFDSEAPKISLQRNKLKKIDCEIDARIGGLSVEENFDLTEIKLNDCQIDIIDASDCKAIKITVNDNLKSLTMKNTKVTEINLNSVKSLTTVSFENSSLSVDILDQVFKLENLTYLDLSHNFIGPLNISTFAKLKNLQSLYLKDTGISQIVFGSFSHQHQLKTFDISDNKLGYFDMNMIFSMSSLLSLDLSGNELQTLDNVESSHYMFTLLAKIDLSNNKWPCSYLMRLIKIFRTYRVSLARSNLEESKTNLHGIACMHVEGQDDIEPVDTTANLTDIREKMNDLIKEMGKNVQFRTNMDTRILRLESRVDSQISSVATSAALRSEKSEKLEVQNSTLLETALIIVCICFAVFMTLQAFSFIKRNFLGQPRPMRSSSVNPLTMNVE